MDSLVISKNNITKEDLLRISDALKPYDKVRTKIFTEYLRDYLEPEDVKRIKERGLPDEIQIDLELYHNLYDKYIEDNINSNIQHESLFHLTGIRITKLKLNHENQVIFIWNTNL